MNSKLVIGSAFAALGAVVVACTFTTERPADSSPPPSPPPAAPTATPTATATTPVVVDAGTTAVADAGATTDAGADAGTVTDAGTSDAGAAPPKKKPLPQREKKSATDAGAATGDGGS
jgi:hypothetical protein